MTKTKSRITWFVLIVCAVTLGMIVWSALVRSRPGPGVAVDPPSLTSGRGPRTVTTATTSPTTTATTTPKSVGSVGEPIPLGTVHNVEGWDVKVVSVVAVPVDDVSGASAPAGFVFKQYTLNATRTDDQPDTPYTLNPRLLGASHVERGAGDQPICLSNAGGIDAVHKGGTVVFKACISVTASDAAQRSVLGLGLFHTTWFAIDA